MHEPPAPGLAAEVTLPVGPLSRADAVSLLVDRARAADPGFVPGDRALLASVCERVDDLPLAIELAAPWVRIAATADLPALAGRSDLGGSTRRDLPARQQTMRATVRWSHDLLTGDEQVLLRRTAVFRGSADLAAVTAVCAGGCLPPDRIGALVARLAEQSVLAVVRPPDGRVRYRLLDVVRDLAAEQLGAAGETPELGRRHVAHYLARAGHVDGARRRSGADAAVAELVADADNHRAALEWGLRHDPQGALRLAVALEAFWMVCSVGEGREWLLQALERAPGPTLDRARALVVPPLVVAGGLPWERVRPMIGTAEEIFTAHSDGPGAALARQTFVLSAFFHGRLAEALRASEPPVRDGPALLRARAAVYRGTVLAYTPRRSGEGCRLLATGLAAAQEVGDGWGAGLASTMLGLADLRSGRPDAAWPRLVAALSGRLQAGVTAAALGGTAQLALARDPRWALTLLEAAEALRDRSGGAVLPGPGRGTAGRSPSGCDPPGGTRRAAGLPDARPGVDDRGGARRRLPPACPRPADRPTAGGRAARRGGPQQPRDRAAPGAVGAHRREPRQRRAGRARPAQPRAAGRLGT